MWIQEFSREYQGVLLQDVWAVATDINKWPTWHGDLDYCKMTGPFEVGNFFMLKPKYMGPVKIVLTEIVVQQRFTDCTTFFGAKMYDTHEYQATTDGVIVKNKLVVTGWLQWLWVFLVARYVANSIPEETDALIERVRNLR